MSIAMNQSISPLEVGLAIAALVGVPIMITGHIPTASARSFFLHIRVCWNGVLHFSTFLHLLITWLISVIYAQDIINDRASTKKCRVTPLRITFFIAFVFFAVIGISNQLQMIMPSWLWNPLIWLRYRVYSPEGIPNAVADVCINDYNILDRNDFELEAGPLCLSKENWKTLSSGALSRDNPADVKAVLRGVKFARDESGGFLLGVLARNTMKDIDGLRLNVEGLAPFFQNKLSVVIFENDSTDGSRDAFKRWAREAKAYKVDLISCGKSNPDCKLQIRHRYEAAKDKEFFKSSSVGNMGEYRQRVLDHILMEESYSNYSHMLVFDYDLGISFSPLGILHSIGTLPSNPIAVNGRFPYPGSLGTIVMPYDLGALRVPETLITSRLLHLQSKHCGIRPPDDRWQSMCDAASTFQLILSLILTHQHPSDPYVVYSSFNGGVLYPLELVRRSHARYDAGEHGQRNEHVGLHLSLNETMYVNPKWSVNTDPARPPGPTGILALFINFKVITDPYLCCLILGPLLLGNLIFAYSVTIISLYLYQITCPLFAIIERFWYQYVMSKDQMGLTPKKKQYDV